MPIFHRSYRLSNTTVFFVSACFMATVAYAEEKTLVLDVNDISAWEHKEFSGNTLYTPSTMALRKCIKAESHQAASGMFKETKIDLNKTPIMHWDWFVENTLGDIKETEKQGDDYAARLYVVISGGVFFWNTQAINYVWASQKPQNDIWENAFSSNAMMVAVESGTQKIGRWVHESRNVRDDIKNLLNIETQYIDAVAIMTDTDNSAKKAVACYGNIVFTSK